MSRQIHITALAPYKIFPAKMGGQKGIALFYQYLSRLLPITVISTKNNDVPADQSSFFLPVLGNSRLRYINPFLFFKVRNIIRENRSTHFILEHPYYGWLGIMLKLFCNIKLVIHSHNMESLRFKSTGKWWWKILWYYEKMTHRHANINFFITDEDRQFATKEFKLDPRNCHTITYGIEFDHAPSINEKTASRNILEQTHEINAHDHILLFNGTLDYKPNLDALDVILDQINPLLLEHADFKYKIIICGKKLPAQYQELKKYSFKNIIYAGFVNDINVYFKGADIFINPVIDGGGIKTKLVEALGLNLSAVSTESGAIGVLQTITGNKLHITTNNDWSGFVSAILKTDPSENIPLAFFMHFYWGNIATRVVNLLATV